MYEKPYNVTGIVVKTGLERTPTDICTDRIIGTWKAIYMENLRSMKWYL